MQQTILLYIATYKAQTSTGNSLTGISGVLNRSPQDFMCDAAWCVDVSGRDVGLNLYYY